MRSIHSAHYSAIPRQMVDQLIPWRERSGVTTRMVIVIRGPAAMLGPMSSIFLRFTLGQAVTVTRPIAAVIGSNFICYNQTPAGLVEMVQ